MEMPLNIIIQEINKSQARSHSNRRWNHKEYFLSRASIIEDEVEWFKSTNNSVNLTHSRGSRLTKNLNIILWKSLRKR